SLGVVPVRAVKILQDDANLRLEPIHISQGSYTFTRQSNRIIYLLAPYMFLDFVDLQSQVASRYLSQPSIPPRVNKLIWGQFPIHNPGTYKIKASYFLPGKRRPVSEVTFNTIYSE
ncbi:MAG: hypothetical protein AAGA66_07605, partial [Bacteroidota bacterium]